LSCTLFIPKMLEQHENEVLVFYNSNISAERKILAYAESNFGHVRSIDVATQPVRGTVLEELAMRLNLPLADLVHTDKGVESVPQLGDDTDYIKLVQHNPALLHTPIVVTKTKAGFVHSPGDFAYVQA
jgi:arsenate reductase (glutaredoxin)